MKAKPIIALIVTLGLWTVFSAFSVNEGGYNVGDKIEGFKLKNVDGQMVSLADYPKAKGFIIVFTCNTCPYAKLYEQRINDLNKEYASKGFPVIAINPNDVSQQPGDSFAAMQQRAKDKNYSFPYLHDESQKVTKAFGAEKTPHVYIVKKQNGSMRVAYIGTIDNSPNNAAQANKFYVRDAVDALLAGKEVSKTTTKAIGCTIKWKNS
ncbi:thioredoxin family protein [Rapidithrix thailandica]|uniref:Thioredoxin family protein n=1 Tax=Rapidithrix thailandica TaxID=413964 RepID=A0AAW9RXX4_9BACT